MSWLIASLLRSKPGKGPKTLSRELEAQQLGLTYRGKGDKEFRARFAYLAAVPRGASIGHGYEG